MRISIVSFILCGLIGLGASAASYFDAPHEFPDLFLSAEQRTKPALSANELSERQVLINNALASVYQRLTIPLIQNDGQVHNTRVFPYLQKLAEEKAQGEFKIFAAGGVVRSSIAYLYAEMYKQWLEDPQFDSTSFLKNFAQEEADLPGLQVRGIGSDFDILIQDPTGQNGQLKEEILEVINSAETQFGLTSFKDDLKKTMVTVGDVKGYSEQMARATAQGGSTLDFLTFDISDGKLLEPQEFPNTITDLLRGYLTYAAPASANAVEDLPKQTVRGLRPLLELPFVRYKDESVLRQELKTLETSALSDRAAEQITKLARNARFAGANNRFYRGAPGSLEQLIHQTFQQKSLLSQIPRYIDFNPLNQRGADRGLNGFPPSLLMSRERFDLITNNGTLYHGTPQIGAGLSIMRSGLFESSISQGRAAWGRGAYSAANPNTALSYAGGGLVFRIQVKKDPRVNIIDWDHVKSDKFIQALQAECTNKNTDIFEELSRRYHIDIILNNYVLIENQDAILLPSSFGDLLESYRYRVLSTSASWNEKTEALRYYIHLSRYAKDLGVPITPLGDLVEQLISSGQCDISQILQLFKSSKISLDIFSFPYVQWIKKALLRDFSQQKIRVQLLLTLSKAEKDAGQFALSDAELAALQPTLSQELRLRLINFKSQPTKSDIDLVRTLANGSSLAEKMVALPILYSITGDSAPFIEFLHSLSTGRKNPLPTDQLRAFFELTAAIKNPSMDMKKAVLATAPELGTQQLLFSGIFSSPRWFTDLNEILAPLQNAKNKNIFYSTILQDPRWQKRPELDQFLFDEIKNGDRLKVLRALKESEVYRLLARPQQILALLIENAGLNYSTDFANQLFKISSWTPSLTEMDTIVLGALRAGKEIPADFLSHSISIKKLPNAYQFLQQHPDYLRLKVPEGSMKSLIRAEPDAIDLVTSVTKFDTLVSSSILGNVSLLDRPALQLWLKQQIQSNPNKSVIFEILTTKPIINRADWVSLAALYANQKETYRENILLSPNVRQNRGQLEALEKTLGAGQNLSQKKILKLKEFRSNDFELASEIPTASLSAKEMGQILTSAKNLKGTKKFNQVMDSYLNDSRFKLHYFAAFAEVFENLPFDLQKRSLVSLINDSQYAAFSVFREASSAAYVALASLPGPSMEVIITRLLLYSRLNDLLKQRDVRAEPFPTLLPKFLKAAEKTKSLPNLSYFFEFQPTMPDAKSLEVFAALDADAAIKYIFKHQRFDTNSLAVLRALATKNKQPYLLMKSLIENPHFPNRTAWLESLIQSKSGLEILMRINVSKGTLNIFSPKDPAFQPVMRAALQNSKNKDLLKLNPDWVNALTLAIPSKTQINHPLCRQVFQ